MSRICSICGKGAMSGNNVSHSRIRTRRKWSANVQKMNIVDDSGKETNAYVCTRCLRTMRKQEK
ncbi:MAG: 50S ribosomal protein L28 [Firmicutes bacterium ADurb.Bin080]|jgi:large subunit ribosomal protein L28|nr:50S ribosomal protein L28 [Clostridiales bacterium]OQC13306.1 MAG: 50S ribosomal protein L28 [Firmicutes bacterium ADurb.Bin080]